MITDWDYSDRAHTYDKRADYSGAAVAKLLRATGCEPGTRVADVGAGTGKLTKDLLKYGLSVVSIEPNDNMRKYGEKNTEGSDVTWMAGVGEHTGLHESSVAAAFFGSSFNVVDQATALDEVARIVQPGGWFACMWNHRDTEDPCQNRIEQVIHSYIPSYDYGLRRQNPSEIIQRSGHFGEVGEIEERFVVKMRNEDIVEAWRSHDTLFRQADGLFEEVILAISGELDGTETEVPYFTRIWFAQISQGSPAEI